MHEYKTRILKCLDQLRGLELVGGTEIDALRQKAEAETSPQALFFMYQSIREIFAKETGDDTGFTFSLPDGTLSRAKTIEDARAQIRCFQQKKNKVHS